VHPAAQSAVPSVAPSRSHTGVEVDVCVHPAGQSPVPSVSDSKSHAGVASLHPVAQAAVPSVLESKSQSGVYAGDHTHAAPPQSAASHVACCVEVPSEQEAATSAAVPVHVVVAVPVHDSWIVSAVPVHEAAANDAPQLECRSGASAVPVQVAGAVPES
jgi:hypothetical protein